MNTALKNVLEFEAPKKADILSFLSEPACRREKEDTITQSLCIA